MRSVRGCLPAVVLLPLIAWPGCATTSWNRSGAPEIEMIQDDTHPAERPILPGTGYELLIKEEPNLPGYRPLRLRLLLAQPGRLVLHLYDTGPDGRPGKLLDTIDRAYGPELASNGSDGKWIVESVPELPVMKGPIWVGIGVPDPASGARLWASANDSGKVYQRDVEPQTAIISAPVHYTPMVRLSLQPQQ